MPRSWGSTGVTELEQVQLDSETKERIREELPRDVAASDSFFRAIEGAIEVYKAGRKLVEESRPGRVRSHLKSAVEAAEELATQLDDLDGNSRQLVRLAGSLDYLGAQRRAIEVLKALQQAAQLAEEYPKQGRLPEHAEQILAADVAYALKTHLNIQPTTTHSNQSSIDSTYLRILKIVSKAATNRPHKAIHALAQKGLAVRRLEQADGSVRWEFPEDSK